MVAYAKTRPANAVTAQQAMNFILSAVARANNGCQPLDSPRAWQRQPPLADPSASAGGEKPSYRTQVQTRHRCYDGSKCQVEI